MSWKEFLIDVIIPLISGFLGGSIGSVVIHRYKIKKEHKMTNKKTIFNNNGDVTNGDKNKYL